jgi:hypothetical protein
MLGNAIRSTRLAAVGLVVAAMIMVVTAGAASTAPALTFTLSPGTTVAAGSVLKVTDASQCQGAATVAVKAPQGEGAVAFANTTGPGWVVSLAIPASVPPGAYVVSATCGDVAYDPVDITITAAAVAVRGNPALTG